MSVDVEAGLMYFKLYKSAQLVEAYREASRIVVSCIVRSTELDCLSDLYTLSRHHYLVYYSCVLYS